MRKALIIGINGYPVNPLCGCINDAKRVEKVLKRNYDGSINFHTKLVTDETVTEKEELYADNILELIENLFDNDDISLLYFSGHGYLGATGGKIVTLDFKAATHGISMDDILKIANNSKAKDKFIILDCCHSGLAGTPSLLGEGSALIGNGVTILTACKDKEFAMEDGGSGVFTSLFVDALNGGASDLRGNVTTGSLYAYIDEALNAWEQRPVFKTNVNRFTSLRQCEPPIALGDLRRITEIFPDPYYVYQLDPEYEPLSENPVKEKTEKFAVLQKYNRVRLLVPIGAPHMYFAAMESKACKLTSFGHQYWRLVKEEKL